MAKAAVFLPGSIPAEDVKSAIASYPNIEPMYIEQIPNSSVEETAEKLILGGCDLFVARGLQAQMLQRLTGIPVVPLRITAQELGMMVQQIQKDFGRQQISIALIGFVNMYCDTSHFDELFGASINKYYVHSIDEIEDALKMSVEARADAVIGGRHCCRKASGFGIPAYFASGGSEGLSETLSMAQQIAELIDTKRRDAAELSAMIDNNFNGILQIGKRNNILKANRVMQNILSRDTSEIIGKRAEDLIPELRQIQAHDVMNGQDNYSAMILHENVSYAVNISPVEVDGSVNSAILTFQEGKRIRQLNQELRRELLRKGHIASYTFERNTWDSPSMKQIVRTAKQIAGYPAPVLITGERGVEKTVLAQCIHNASMQRDNSFIEIECSGYSPDKLDKMLFGSEQDRPDKLCLAELAQDGTLYLKNVERLLPETQYKLRSLINGRRLLNTSDQFIASNVRVIASTESDLSALTERGLFRNDLCYELSTVKLDIEPLRNRREDVRMYIKKYTETFQKQYDRFIHLTKGAEELLEQYDWPGNMPQLRNVCQRIVLLSSKRDVDESFAAKQLENSYVARETGLAEEPVAYKDKKAQEIFLLLQKHQGKREKVAAELGISKTTLWRYMKKYGIGE